MVLALLTADASGCKALAAQVRTDEHSPDKTINCVELPSSLSVRQAGGRAERGCLCVAASVASLCVCDAVI
eukprot:COSAG06_NODE_404_length_16134_cov_88.503336_12_plen_71_part_00